MFGIAVYPNVKKTPLPPLPPITKTLTYHESIAGGAGYVNLYSHTRYVPQETKAVRRRPTTVDIAKALEIAHRVNYLRQYWAREPLARALGVKPRDLHLAELGCVQPEAYKKIAHHIARVPDVPEDTRSLSSFARRRFWRGEWFN